MTVQQASHGFFLLQNAGDAREAMAQGDREAEKLEAARVSGSLFDECGMPVAATWTAAMPCHAMRHHECARQGARSPAFPSAHARR